MQVRSAPVTSHHAGQLTLVFMGLTNVVGSKSGKRNAKTNISIPNDVKTMLHENGKSLRAGKGMKSVVDTYEARGGR